MILAVLGPVKRFVSSFISPDESRMLQLIEPDEALQLVVEDYDDNDN